MKKYYEYYFNDVCCHVGKDYDYLWSAKDSHLHRHVDFYELFFVVSGEPCHYYRGTKETLHKNQMFIFKPGEQHHIYTEPHQSFHFTFFARPSFMEAFLGATPYLQTLFDDKDYISCEMTDVEFSYIYKLADSLIHQPEDEEKVFLFLYNALSIMKWNTNMISEKKANIYVLDILQKINNHTFLTVTLQEIYERYPMSRNILSRDFREYTGMTIVQYQKISRLKYAAQLLIKSDYKITDIAGMVAYDSLGYFVRAFKEEYGMAPRDYREAHSRKI